MAMAQQQYPICLQHRFAELVEIVEVKWCSLAGYITVMAMGQPLMAAP